MLEFWIVFVIVWVFGEKFVECYTCRRKFEKCELNIESELMISFGEELFIILKYFTRSKCCCCGL